MLPKDKAMKHGLSRWMIAAIAVLMGLAMVSGATAQKAMGEDCPAFAEATWLETLTAEAEAIGECDIAEIALTVRNGAGEVVWSAAYAVGDLFGFDELYTTDDMRVALTDWLTANTTSSITSELPEWPQGAEGPDTGEFPFFVEEGISREAYDYMRGEDRATICYVQGRESMLCLLHDPGTDALYTIGVQTFPG